LKNAVSTSLEERESRKIMILGLYDGPKMFESMTYVIFNHDKGRAFRGKLDDRSKTKRRSIDPFQFWSSVSLLPTCAYDFCCDEVKFIRVCILLFSSWSPA
jgi:hypothetical protein